MYSSSHDDAVSGAAAPAPIVRYAVGSIGTGGFATLPGLVLLVYLTDTLGIAAASSPAFS